MASQVIKKDGTKEPFDEGKIRRAISAAATQAGIAEDKKSEVVGTVTSAVLQLAGAKEEIATSEIRDKILSELDRIEPSVAAAWRAYAK